MLTDQQRTYFDVFGFLALRGAFSSRETEEISREFDDVLTGDRQGAAFKGERRQEFLGFVEQRPELTQLVIDDRIHGAVEALLGPGFVWIGSDGNLYVGDTHWHPDNPDPYRRIKVAFYLDPVARDTGCLRVIPGSHRAPLHDRLKDTRPVSDASESPYGVSGSEIPGFPVESTPGDVVFFDQSLWHASFGGKTGRRMFTLNFGAKPKADADYDNLRKTYQQNRRHASEMQPAPRDRVYSDAFLSSDSPRIKQMVGPLLEMGMR